MPIPSLLKIIALLISIHLIYFQVFALETELLMCSHSFIIINYIFFQNFKYLGTHVHIVVFLFYITIFDLYLIRASTPTVLVDSFLFVCTHQICKHLIFKAYLNLIYLSSNILFLLQLNLTILILSRCLFC